MTLSFLSLALGVLPPVVLAAAYWCQQPTAAAARSRAAEAAAMEAEQQQQRGGDKGRAKAGRRAVRWGVPRGAAWLDSMLHAAVRSRLVELALLLWYALGYCWIFCKLAVMPAA